MKPENQSYSQTPTDGSTGNETSTPSTPPKSSTGFPKKYSPPSGLPSSPSSHSPHEHGSKSSSSHNDAQLTEPCQEELWLTDTGQIINQQGQNITGEFERDRRQQFLDIVGLLDLERGHIDCRIHPPVFDLARDPLKVRLSHSSSHSFRPREFLITPTGQATTENGLVITKQFTADERFCFYWLAQIAAFNGIHLSLRINRVVVNE